MRRLLLVVTLVPAVSCGGSASPSRPTPTTILRPGSLTLSGTISETAPTASTPITAATVTFVEGPNIGSTTTDANGRFQLSGLRPGPLTFRIRAANYVEHLQFLELTADQAIGIELDPVFQAVTTSTTESISGGGDSCPGYWDVYPDSKACTADFLFNVHNAGTLSAEITPIEVDTSFTMELFASIDGRAVGSGTSVDAARTIAVRGHTQYLIRVRKFSDGGGSPPAGVGSFVLTVTRPN
jgi:Carboxypeptidase regulatory-like domain